MDNQQAIVSSPHILEDESLDFEFIGRDEAINTAAKCYRDIIAARGSTASDRTKQAIPVCSGISGLGKTRMLEEGSKKILQEVLELDGNQITSVIVSYFNGFSPQPVEQSMPIEASFSRRMLFRVFLDKNCKYSFEEWFRSQLPRNGSKLTFERAVKVIERKLRENLQQSEDLYLFLGIDEYQTIETVRAEQIDPEKSLLRELVETIGGFLCSKSSNLALLPMFAGTDLAVIASGSIANSSNYVTKRLPMTLLTMDQVFYIAENNASYAGLLKHAEICRNLFSLGGVPRWVVEYLVELKKVCEQGKPVNLDSIKNCMDIWSTYVKFVNFLENQQLVRLAAFAVSGQQVEENDQFDGEFKWSRLRDSSVCLLIPSTPTACDVRVLYALVDSITLSRDEMTDAEMSFATALMDMREMVDVKMFDLQPRQLWEIFGACFYAVGINALLALGRSTVTLGELLPGTMMSDTARSISVKLVPSRVIRCANTFDASTPQRISRQGNPLETIDWTSGGWIAVNGDNGPGVDICFALEDAVTGKVVVFVDQRKRQLGQFQPCHAQKYFNQLCVCPGFLRASGARLVRGIMNCVSSSNLASYVVPDDCFILSRARTEQFHGTLAYHPACSPVISVNSACKTALKTLFQGNAKEVDQLVGEIVRKRVEPSGGFSTLHDLVSFIETKRLKVEVDGQYAEFSS